MEASRRSSSTALAAGLVSLVLLGACAGEPPEEGAGPSARDAPAETATEAGDVAGSHGDADVEGAVPEGRRLFRETGCGACHTLADARTSGTVGPDLDDHFREHDHERARRAIVRQIENGGGGMPAFRGRLTDEEIRVLADYVIVATSR